MGQIINFVLINELSTMRTFYRIFAPALLLLFMVSGAPPKENNSDHRVAENKQQTIWHIKALHPDGYTLVTDLLIGIAADNCSKYQGETVEIDIMMIAEPRKVSKDDLERMVAQANDL